jgi:hypothetical protein
VYTAVRRYRVREVDTIVQRVEEGFVDQVKGLDGFVGYYVVDGGGGNMVTVTVAESREAIEESSTRAADFVRENIPDLVEEKLDETVGEVRVRAEP